jgi:hypothetical protein
MYSCGGPAGRPQHGPTGVDGERHDGGNERARERRIEELTRELAETINASDVDGREGLREAVVTRLREGIEAQPPRAVVTPAADRPFNPFAIAIPMTLMGAVLVFLFPLMGLLMFGAAAVMITWGIVVSMLARS